jgi:hypothetical protein
MSKADHKADHYEPTGDDVAVVLQAIQAGRVSNLQKAPFDPDEWTEESVREWLEHFHEPSRARRIVSDLRRGLNVVSAPLPASLERTLYMLAERIGELEREVAELRARAR